MVPRFQGYRLLRTITALAWEMKIWPSEVYEQIVEKPRDVLLMLEWSRYIGDQQQKELNKTKSDMNHGRGTTF